MKPLAANVLMVRSDTLADKTQSIDFAGSHVAVTAQEVEGSRILRPGKESKMQSKPSEGIVRAIGPEVTLTIKEGDRVLYRPWTGIECRVWERGEEVAVDHQLTPQRDILAIVDEGERVEVIERPLAQPAQQQRR